MSAIPQDLYREIAADLRPVRPLRPAWVRALVLLPCAAAGLALLSFLLGPRWLAEPPLSLAGAGVQLLLAYALLVLALGETIPGTRTGIARPVLAVGASLLAFLGFLFALHGTHPMAVPPGMELAMVLRCLGFSLLLGVVPGLLGFGLIGRGLPARPGVAGVLGGLAAGLAAVSVWQLFCAGTEPAHVLTGHGGAVLALAGAGLALGLARRARQDAAWARRRA
jgi:hypothetical protein